MEVEEESFEFERMAAVCSNCLAQELEIAGEMKGEIVVSLFRICIILPRS